MTKESVTSVWEQIQVTKNSDFRNPVLLENDTVSVDSKNVYIGNSQWVIKAKKLQEIKIVQGDVLESSKPSSIVLTMATDEFRVTLSHMIHEQGWVKFYKRLEKFVKHSNTTLQVPLSTKQQQHPKVAVSNNNKPMMNKHGRYNNNNTSRAAFFESTGKARFSPARPSKRPLQQQRNNDTDDSNTMMMSPRLPTTRKGRVFGRKTVASPRTQIPWDEDDGNDYVLKKENQDSSVLATADTATNDDNDDDQVLVESDNVVDEDDDQVLVGSDDDSEDEEALFDDAPAAKGKRRFIDDSEDDDDDNDEHKKENDGITIKRTKTVPSPTRTAATPRRNRPKVSPASRTQTKINGQVVGSKPSQKGISSFFAPRQPASAATTTSTVTASSFDPSKRIVTTPIRTSTAIKPSAWLEQSQAGLSSPSKKRKQDLFGTATGFKTPPRKESEDDPIEEFSSPLRTTNAAMDALDRADQDPRQKRLEFMVPKTTGHSYKKRPRVPLTPPRRLDLEACNAKTGTSAGEVETAIVPKNPWKGLRNHGNTCYLSASVQMLATLASTCRGRHNWWEKLRGRGGPLTRSLLDVVDQLGLAPLPGSTVVSPRQVKAAMDVITNKFIGFEQRDAHEFLSDLIDSVHEELDPPKDKLNEVAVQEVNAEAGSEVNSPANDSKVVSGATATNENHGNSAESNEPMSTNDSTNNESLAGFPTDDFRMTVEVCLKCESCGYSRTKKEMYRHLSLDIISDNGNEKVHIPVSLNHFFQPEIREIRCEKCTEGTHASQSQRIVSCPKYLLLHLKRFIFVERPIPAGNENAPPNSPSSRPAVEYIFRKNKAPVEIVEELSLDPFCVDPASQGYKLRSLVYHMGAKPSSGHYTADAVRPYREVPQTENVDSTAKSSSLDLTNATTDEATNTDSPPEEEWITFDDQNAAKTSLSKIQNSTWKRGAAYMLLYSLD